MSHIQRKEYHMNENTGLYGLYHSNRSVDSHWSKNCFNSSFPTAMANYMLDHDIPAIYIKLVNDKGTLKTKSSTINLRDVYHSGTAKPSELEFCFEAPYAPYQAYSFDEIDGIDLVVKDGNGKPIAPLEVKLTVLPTSGTCKLPAEEWGCELVVRTATTSYCAFGMFDATHKKSAEIREIFEPACSSIQSWDNDFEMTHKTPAICEALDEFENKFLAKQKPLLIEPIWKTKGQSPFLDDEAFDLVVWSDYAFSRLFIDNAKNDTSSSMSRYMRASARLARCLWELSKSGKIHIDEIYRQMAFGNQTDKEFAINGQTWRRYVSSKRILHPILPKTALQEIIAPGFIEHLRPERRFDQTLYFTMRN